MIPRALQAVPTEDYAAIFDAFFGGRPNMASVYKPLLLRSLLDAIAAAEKPGAPGGEWIERGDDGQISVKLDFVAACMTKYCWDMHHSFRIRQSQVGMNADIIAVIAENGGAAAKLKLDKQAELRKPPSLRDLAGNDRQQLRNGVINRCIKKQVLWRLPADLPDLYETDGVGEKNRGAATATTIFLSGAAADYMRSHKAQIRNGLNQLLAVYLEKINVMTPKIASKVDYDAHGGNIFRPILGAEVKRKMQAWQGRRCFYCEYTLGADAGRREHVDHVVPFGFVYSTRAYNCVVACQECNCVKSDKLPSRSLFKCVLDRNDEDDKRDSLLAGAVPEYTRGSYDRLFSACRSEYNRGRRPFSPGLQRRRKSGPLACT